MINEERRIIQEEALTALEQNNYNGAVILPTGTGKSYVLIEALKRIYKQNFSVLYTCDSIRLRDVDFNNELKKWNAEDYVELIEKQCYASACKKKGEHYNVLLADEGDYALTPEYKKLFFNNKFDHIIFVSATLEAKKRAIAREIVPIVYEKKVKEIEDRGVVNKVQFHYVPYVLNEKENQKYLEYNKQFADLLNQKKSKQRDSRLQFLTYERMHFLAKLDSSADICRRLIKQLREEKEDIRTLVFCNATEQADRIAPSYHTKSDDKHTLEWFNDGTYHTLAVCGKIDRGVNLEAVNTVIMEYITASETKAIQKIGRGKRLSVDDILNCYILIPYFRKWGLASRGSANYSSLFATIVLKKAQQACKEIGIANAKTYIVK